MKVRGSKDSKMARQASMDLAGFDQFDFTPDALNANDQEEAAAEHTYPSEDNNVAEDGTETPQLNLAAIRQTLGPRSNSGGSIGVTADPADIMSTTTAGTSRRGRLAGRFSKGDVAKMKRRGTSTSGFTATSSSIGSSNVSMESNLWTKLLSNTNASLWNDGGFEDDEDDDADDGGALPGCNQAVKTWCRGNAYEAKHVSI